MDISAFASALGGLGIGSVITGLLASGRDRRSARADFLTALAVCEAARWAPREPETPTYNVASRDLQTAALVARIPRSLLAEYLALARAAWWSSESDWEGSRMDPELDGNIDPAFADLVRSAAQGLADIAWSNQLRRALIQARRLRSTRRDMVALKPFLREQIAMARRFGT